MVYIAPGYHAFALIHNYARTSVLDVEVELKDRWQPFNSLETWSLAPYIRPVTENQKIQHEYLTYLSPLYSYLLQHLYEKPMIPTFHYHIINQNPLTILPATFSNKNNVAY